MLELDVLLDNFLEQAYSLLSTSDQALFERLLATPDPELFDYLMGKAIPNDKELARMTELIRQHAKSRI